MPAVTTLEKVWEKLLEVESKVELCVKHDQFREHQKQVEDFAEMTLQSLGEATSKIEEISGEGELTLRNPLAAIIDKLDALEEKIDLCSRGQMQWENHDQLMRRMDALELKIDDVKLRSEGWVVKCGDSD